MARTNKVGIDYFPLDTGFFTDDKLQLVESEFGIEGSYIALRLLCKIYREGCFYRWGEDQCLLFAKSIGMQGVTARLTAQVVAALVRREFFSKKLFDRYGVLTSKGIQQRYFEATRRYNRVEAVAEYTLVNLSGYDNVHLTTLSGKPKRKAKQKATAQKFCPPSLEQVSAYCAERGNTVDPARFVSYYQANGWITGKTRQPMKDWKAAIRGWEQAAERTTEANKAFTKYGTDKWK